MTLFVRLIETPVHSKPESLLQAVAGLRQPGKSSHDAQRIVFETDHQEFTKIPGSPFAYWVGDSVRQLFVQTQPLASQGRLAVAGLQTSDDFRFVRAWWEVPYDRLQSVWWPFAKGGTFSPFRAAMNLTVNWKDDGKETKAFAEKTPGSNHWSRNLRNAEHYRRPGLTWLRRSHRVCASALPSGSFFSDGAQAILAEREQLDSIGAAVNSAAFDGLVKLAVGRTGAGVQFMPGMISAAPFNGALAKDKSLASAFRRGFSAQYALSTAIENSHAFRLPPGLNERILGLDRKAIRDALVSIQKEIDNTAYRLYGIGPEDRTAIEASSELNPQASEGDAIAETGHDDPGEDEAIATATADAVTSWLVGVAFGRFDPRLATGERAIPTEPEPFDPLPTRSPGMYPEGEEPADQADILVDDEGHPKDLTTHVERWAEHVGVEVPTDLRTWLARDFFPLHIKMYSKSRRKAPIYWQLATPSASYSVWLYIHAFTRDTLFRVQNDYVAPKLAHEERQLETLRAEAGPDPLAEQRKAIEAQEAFVEELRAFLDEVKRIAPLWNPNLDDGVIINFAPLWRLVPHHKQWQKELKSTWDALCAGKYDWSHLAMHLWPERVIPKCAEDRSLAIAHDLEDVFWYQDDDEKWKPREKPTTPIDVLVEERTSPAVKAALKSLMEAPELAASTRRARRGRRK